MAVLTHPADSGLDEQMTLVRRAVIRLSFMPDPGMKLQPKDGTLDSTINRAYGGARKRIRDSPVEFPLIFFCLSRRTSNHSPWPVAPFSVARFQSRFRSETSHGEGVTQENIASNGKPQTP